MKTIEDLKKELETIRPDYEKEVENTTGDETTYAQGQLAMLDLVLDMLK